MDEKSFIHRFFVTLERSLSWLDSLAKAIGLGIFVAVLALNFNAIVAGVHGLAEKLPHLVKFSALGVNVELDPETLASQFKSDASPSQWLKDHWTTENTKNAIDGLNAIDSRERARLLNVGVVDFTVCRAEKPSADVLYAYASDVKLQQVHLAEIKPRPDLVPGKREEAAKKGDPVPASCYDIGLTGPGFDVRTMLIQTVAAGPTTPGMTAPASEAPANRPAAATAKSK